MRIPIWLLLTLSLTSCGMHSWDPPAPDGLKSGPGLFTGRTGEFVIVRPEELK